MSDDFNNQVTDNTESNISKQNETAINSADLLSSNIDFHKAQETAANASSSNSANSMLEGFSIGDSSKDSKLSKDTESGDKQNTKGNMQNQNQEFGAMDWIAEKIFGADPKAKLDPDKGKAVADGIRKGVTGAGLAGKMPSNPGAGLSGPDIDPSKVHEGLLPIWKKAAAGANGKVIK